MGPNNKNNNKPRPNYFTNNINRMGENFLEYKNSKDIDFDCPIVFRQLARRQIDLEMCGHFFLDIHFLKGCIEATEKRMRFFGISYECMERQIRQYTCNRIPIDQETLKVYETHKNAYKAYCTINYHLNQMLAYRNLAPLYNLCDILYNDQILKNSIL